MNVEPLNLDKRKTSNVHKKYVRKLDDARTVVRVDAPVADKVGIVTGGGSGHKPAFIGFVGQGMLDAVAVGEIFTSPPPMACIEAAKAAISSPMQKMAPMPR